MDDVVVTAAAVARAAGLSIIAVDDHAVLLADPLSQRVVLRLVAGVDEGPDDVLFVRRLTFGFDDRRAVTAAAGVAVRAGARALRALEGDGFGAIHVAGPAGLELGFEHCRGFDTARSVLAVHPSRFIGSRSDRVVPARLTRVHVSCGPERVAGLQAASRFGAAVVILPPCCEGSGPVLRALC